MQETWIPAPALPLSQILSLYFSHSHCKTSQNYYHHQICIGRALPNSQITHSTE